VNSIQWLFFASPEGLGMAQEATLQGKILRDLDSKGKHCLAFKIQKANINGVPDIFFVTRRSGPVFLETKAVKGVVSPIQKERHDELMSCGCRVFVCNSWKCWVNIKGLFNI